MLNEEVHKIRKLIYELSPNSSGVQEVISQVKKNPELLSYLNFNNFDDLENFLYDSGYDDYLNIKNEIEKYFEDKKENLNSEMDEIERTVQFLNREENMDVSVKDLLYAFQNSKEIELSKQIWEKLENTEYNTINKGETKKVTTLAKKYNKSKPKDLKKQLMSDTYKRPLILNFNNRYYLVAGNTRLSTAAALGFKPKVFLAKL